MSLPYNDSLSTLAEEALRASSTAMNRFSREEIANRVSMNRRELENSYIDLREMWRDPEMRPLVMAEFVALFSTYTDLGELLAEVGSSRDQANVVPFARAERSPERCGEEVA